MIPVLGFLLETAQHRALVPFYLVIWAGTTSFCAEGREGWQDKAPLPLGASVSSFRPLSFVCSLQILPVVPPQPLSGEGAPSALPGTPLSLTAQQLYLLPCHKEQRRCCVESPVPPRGMTTFQSTGAGSLPPARARGCSLLSGWDMRAGWDSVIGALCCWHSRKSWGGSAIPDATGEGKRRIIMAISHCTSLKPVSLGDCIFPR